MRSGVTSLAVALLLGALPACYLSHRGVDAEPRRDAGPPRDVGAPAPDSSRLPGCGALQVLDRRVDDWPSMAVCGPVSAATVARTGGYDQVARESGATCGRAPQVAARRGEVADDALVLGEDQVLTGLHPAATGLVAAEDEDTLIVASGVALSRWSGTYEPVGEGLLGEVPESVPGCVMARDVVDLVPHPDGWLAAFDYFECDVSGSQLQFFDRALEPVTMLETVWPGIGAAGPHANGAAYVGKVRPGVETTPLVFLDEPAGPPREVPLAASGSAVAMARWPFDPSSLAMVFLDREGVELVVVDGEGAVTRRRRVPFPEADRLVGYGPVSVHAAATELGLLVAVPFVWEGGRIDAGYVVLGFGPTAEPLGGSIVASDLGADQVHVSLAGVGEHAVVSVFNGTPASSAAETLLLGCAD